MPNGEVGLFTPTEAAYTRPGGYETSLRAEATRAGTYESEMASFYEQLEQEEEQFGERLGLERERLESEEARAAEMLEWYRSQEAGRLSLERERIAAGTQRARIGARATTTAAQGGGGGRQALTGGAFQPYLTTSEQTGQQPEVTMDWLTQQMQQMYPTSPQQTTGGGAGTPYSPITSHQDYVSGYPVPSPETYGR